MKRILLLTCLTAGCGGGAENRAAPLHSAVVLTASSDALSGAISLIDLDTLEPVPQIEDASGDAVGRVWLGKYYVVNRVGNEGDNIRVHDPQNNYALVREFSVGSKTEATNAQDICCVSANKCYVPRFSAPDLLVVDPEADEPLVGTVDLADLADDGLPNPNACHVAGDKLLVSLANVDDSDPFLTALEPGSVAVIDTTTDEVTTVYDTTVHNPFTGFVPETESTALVGEVGSWGALDGGFDRIDLDTGEPQGMAVTEKALGGDVGRLAICSTGEAYAIVQTCDVDFNCSTPLVRLDLGTGEVGKTIFDPGEYALTWIAADDRGRLWVADRRSEGQSGVWVYDCDGTRITEEPIDVGLPPAFEGVIQFL